jgi:hypothetical protein
MPDRTAQFILTEPPLFYISSSAKSVQRTGWCHVRELPDRTNNLAPDGHAGGVTSLRELGGPPV